MLVKFQVVTAKGVYKDGQVRVVLLKDAIPAIIAQMDSWPEEKDGEKLVDWTSIKINVQRKR